MNKIPLPIDDMLGEIAATVARTQNTILTATPGAGKTTRLPPVLLTSVPGPIVILQPRRLAAIAACQRVADECGWTVGREVGYQVRFESKVSRETRLIFMTDALLVRRLIDDPELKSFSLVVLDEFHERNLNQDLILGFVRELQEMGSSLKLLIMSATLELAPLMRFLPEAESIEVPGKVFPLEVRHFNQPLRLQTDTGFYERVVGAIQSATTSTSGDILVFLPGVGEISRVSERLESLRLNRTIVPLHGSLKLDQQALALRAPRSGERRLILATNVAEASVTVQGVDFVIDTGLARRMSVNLNSGFSALELGRISLFNARQRAGRAAREKAGVCWRLWTEHEEVTQVEQLPPECARTDLSSALLLMAHWGVRDFGDFAWLDRPPGRLLDLARQDLRALGALTAENHLTAMGRQLLRFPLPPRWGALLLAGERAGLSQIAARVAALMNERDFVNGPITTNLECDILCRLDLLDEVARGQKPSGVQFALAKSVLESADQLERLVQKDRDRAPSRNSHLLDGESLRRLFVQTQSDRLCRRRANSNRGLMVGGRGVKLDPESQVRQSEFFINLSGVDLPGQSETSVRLACGLSKAMVLEVLKDQVEITEQIEFVESKSAFFASRERRILGLSLEEPSLTPVQPSQVADRLAEVLRPKWSWLIEQNESLNHWMQRWQFLLQHKADLGGSLGEDQIQATLAMACFGKTSVAQVVDSDLLQFLKMNLPVPLVRMVDEEVPARFLAPSGQSHQIHYVSHGAYVEVRLQELFGLNASPRIVFGQVALAFHLLGPNYRPVQVTSDLAGFWKGAYIEVRKELRARYPKHSWPDDPLQAKPEAKGRRRTT